MKNQKYINLVLSLSLFSALTYNSWPLGYWLSSPTAHYGLASDLEKAGHPYFWLFILGDALSGISALALALVIRFRLWSKLKSKAWSAVYLGLAAFGLFTAVNAVLPTDCNISSVLRCGLGLNNGVGIDAILSSFSMLGLFISLAGVNRFNLRLSLKPNLLTLTQVTLAVWAASGLLFAALALANRNVHTMQQLLISFSGLALVVIGLNLASLLGRVPSQILIKKVKPAPVQNKA